jgi:acyl carrier protein
MATTPEQVADLIEDFVRREYSIRSDDDGFTRDTDLYDSGYVDSIGVTELISLLESTYGIEIPEEDLFSEAFTTINGISLIVCRCSSVLDGASRNAADPTDAEDWLAARVERSAAR